MAGPRLRRLPKRVRADPAYFPTAVAGAAPPLINNYYACMGGGPIMTGDVATTDACYAPNVPGGSVAQFKNGKMGINTKTTFSSVLDGTSNVVMAGESAYQGIELLRGWFNAGPADFRSSRPREIQA